MKITLRSHSAVPESHKRGHREGGVGVDHACGLCRAITPGETRAITPLSNVLSRPKISEYDL
jgi:hypothetical protein